MLMLRAVVATSSHSLDFSSLDTLAFTDSFFLSTVGMKRFRTTFKKTRAVFLIRGGTLPSAKELAFSNNS